MNTLKISRPWEQAEYLYHKGSPKEAIALLKEELETETKERQTLAFCALMRIYTFAGDKQNLVALWKKRDSYSLLQNEIFFRTGILYFYEIGDTVSLKKTADAARQFVPDSRFVNESAFLFSASCKDSLRILTSYFKYYNTLDPAGENRFRTSFIQTLQRVGKTSPGSLFSWARENAKNIPEMLKYDIYNFVDLWKYFPMFVYGNPEIGKSNPKLFLRALISNGRSEVAESKILQLLKDPAMKAEFPYLYEIMGDLYFYQKKYSKALNYYDEGLTYTQSMNDQDIFENLIVKAHCCLYNLLKSSAAEVMAEKANKVFSPYIPAYQVKNSSSGLILLNTLGGPFTNNINDFVLGFCTMVNSAINGMLKDAEIGYLLSTSISKNNHLMQVIEFESMLNGIYTIEALASRGLPYYPGMQKLVTLYEEEYFCRDQNIFAEVDPKSKIAYPPENIFNFWDLSKREALLLSVNLQLLKNDSFATLFRNRVYSCGTIKSGVYIFGTKKDGDQEKLENAKTDFYKQYSIKKDVYFKHLSPDETNDLHEILLLKGESSKTLNFNGFKQKLINFKNKYPEHLTIYYWLAQLESAFGNYTVSNEYINKVVLADPTWKEAVKLKDFCTIANCK